MSTTGTTTAGTKVVEAAVRLIKAWITRIFIAWDSYEVSAGWYYMGSAARLSGWTKAMLYLGDTIITLVAVKGISRVHGDVRYSVLVAMLLAVTVGGWLLDLGFRSTTRTKNVIRRQIILRVVRFVMALGFEIWNRLTATSSNRTVPVLLLVGASCSCGALLVTVIYNWVRFRRIDGIDEATRFLPFGLRYSLLDYRFIAGKERSVARATFEKGIPWPASHRGSWHVPIRQMEISKGRKSKPTTLEDAANLTPQQVFNEVPTQEFNEKPVQSSDLALLDGTTDVFSRCYCCLDGELPTRALPLLMPNKKRPIERLKRFQDLRSSFLDRKPTSPFGDINELSADFSYEMKPHRLCSKCELMCEGSPWLNENFNSGFGVRKDPRSQSFFSPIYDMCFEHYSTPAELARSVQGGCEQDNEHDKVGCHLCSLIWATLSQYQQDELLRLDAELQADLERALREAEETGKPLVDVRKRFHARRCVIIKIENAAVGGWSWTAGIPSTRSARSEIRLVPHFGGTRIANKWMDQRVAARHLSLNEDLSPDLCNEQSEAIIIQGLPDLPGPLRLPITTSTKTDSTMKLISKFLESHENCFRADSKSDAGKDTKSTDDPLLAGQEEAGKRPHLEHEKPPPGKSKLPARLIDVSGSNIEMVRIFDTVILDGTKDNTAYLALTHCWGKSVSSTLTRETLPSFYGGIEISTLAQTFQDAIYVTRGLGFSYLWIDSLCIIQGDDADWTHQALLMKDVYVSSACVIGALASWDSSESFFAEQNALELHPCLISVCQQSKKRGGNYGIYALPNSRYTECAIEDFTYSRLASRGWCLQEDILAKQVVWFGPNQLMFTCRDRTDPYHSKTRNFTQAGEYPWTAGSSLKHIDKAKDQQEIPKDDGQAELFRRFRRGWTGMITIYTDRSLTRNSDKLIAHAGFSSICQEYLAKIETPPSPYISGLWGGPHLPSSLLWYVQVRHPRPLATSYRGTSFSWPSVDGTIVNNSYNAEISTCELDIIEAVSTSNSITTLPDFPLAEVYASWLRVRGKIALAKVQPRQQARKKWYYVGHRSSRTETAADLVHLEPCRSDPTLGPEIFHLSSMSGQKVGMLLPDTEEAPPDEVYCLQIIVKAEDVKTKEDWASPFVTRGLALVKVPSEETVATGADNTYRRIGYIELEKKPCDVGGFTYPDIRTGPLLRRGNGLPARRPWPNIDSYGFFKDVEKTEIWIVKILRLENLRNGSRILHLQHSCLPLIQGLFVGGRSKCERFDWPRHG